MLTTPETPRLPSPEIPPLPTLESEAEQAPTTAAGSVQFRSERRTPAGPFPFNSNKRRFSQNWYENYTWLEYESESDLAFCHPCRQLVQQNVILPSKAENSFTVNGFKFWNRANEAFSKHEKSEAHRDAVYKFSQLFYQRNVLDQVNAQYSSERKEATRCLTEIFTTLQILGRQGLAVRGKDDFNSNIRQILRLRTRDNKELQEWLQRKTTWTSHEIQNEMMDLMANTVLRTIAATLRNRVIYSVLCDETADNCGTEQLSISIRTVNDDFEAEEHFLGFYALQRCDAEYISKCILDVLQRFDLSVNNMRGQCYDGASVMSGHVSGVAACILNLEPRAVFTHCQMHSLNLAVQDCISEIPNLRDFLALVQDLLVFLRDSPKRRQTLAVAASVDCDQTAPTPTNIRPLCPTRMTMRFHALDGLMKQVHILQDVLDEIAGDTNDRGIQAKVSGYLRRLNDFEFYFCLIVSHCLFEKTDILSKQLQSTKVSTGEGISLCKVTKAKLSEMRNDTCFDDIWKKVEEIAASVDADQPKLPKVRRRPVRYDEGASPHQYTEPKEYYRMLFFQAVDSVMGHITKRIDDKGIEIVSAIDSVIKRAWSGATPDATDEDVLMLKQHFQSDLDTDRLLCQLSILENIRKEYSCEEDMFITDILKVVGGTYLKKMIPEVCRLAKLYSVSPASTASCERSFSQLRRVKSYLRSTMGQKRLNHTCILTVYKEEVDALDIPDVVNTFIKANEFRRNSFAPCEAVSAKL